MGISINNKTPILIYVNDIAVIAVYSNGYKLWPIGVDTLLSCYTNGYWIDEYPWTDDTAWVD